MKASPSRRPIEKWNERYAIGDAPTDASKLLAESLRFFPSCARVLDLACGAGRNSVFLATLGHRVVGIDRSFEGLRQGRELARRRSVEIAWLCADLGNYPLPAAAFDVLLSFYYRDPHWYPRLRLALRPGGLFISETYTLEQLELAEGPRNPAHLLEPGELLGAFGDWTVLYYREGRVGKRAIAQIVAHKPERWGMGSVELRS